MSDPEGGARALWYKDAVIYELHVRAFADSNGDGVGDFPGLTQKLDYLHDLGVTAIWLLPFYPSPLRDDGYDIADYTAIHPAYGTMRDFKAFLKAAHARGMRVITELVLNHTSDQHPWFQRARRARPGSPWRDFYVWSDDPDRYGGARVIFQDSEASNWAWDPDVHAYYWHRFYAHQPDLNYDNPRVRAAILRVTDFWLGLGVDGLRLDAVPYLFEREGTTSENLPRTHAFLRRLRRHVDEQYADRMLLAEANQWPEDAAAYFGAGDECHMAFHFPLMPRLFMALRQEDRFPIADIVAQTPDPPETAQWALFLRNHDELTLEMVTEEERAFMYRVYAGQGAARINLGIRRRLGPLVHNDRRRIELLHGLLFSLPGTPVLYYGDEIGMGDNIYLGDRDGVRTPMQWSADRNAGFSQASPQQLYLPLIVDPEHHHEAVHVEAQQQNPSSLLNWMQRLIALRKRSPAFGRGGLAMLAPANRKVLAFIRHYRDEQILVVANLSRFPQPAELDLAAFAGRVPVELFGRTPLLPIGTRPYPVLLAPHAFLWLALEPPGGVDVARGPAARPVLAARRGWQELFAGPARAELEALLPGYLAAQPWFGGKARTLLGARIDTVVPVSGGATTTYLAQLAVGYADGEPETYVVPFGAAFGARAGEVEARVPGAVVARIRLEEDGAGGEGVLYDAAAEAPVARALLDLIVRNRSAAGAAGTVRGRAAPGVRRTAGRGAASLPVVPVATEQTNTSLRFGDRWVLKLFRRLDDGPNPERTIGQYLTRRGVTFAPAVDGVLHSVTERGEVRDLGILHRFVPHDGTAWQRMRVAARRGFARAATAPPAPPAVDARALLARAARPAARDAPALGDAPEVAAALGRLTAELHCALAEARDDPLFAPEPITPFYQRERYQALRSLVGRVFAALRAARGGFPAPLRDRARRALSCEGRVLERFEAIRALPIGGLRMRFHGNYHLGQLLDTADGWVIIDFEGEPTRPLYERELKQSPLVDVASMLGSIYTAGLLAGDPGDDVGAGPGPGDRDRAQWARAWLAALGSAFLNAYLERAAPGGFLPPEREQCALLLDVLLLERAVYELGYALQTHPGRAGVPLQGLLHLLDRPEPGR